jgi:hypothetical protein
MMFGSVTEYFANLWHIKDAKLVLQVWMHNFEAPKLWSIHSTPLNPKWYMGVLRSSSLIFCTQKDKNLCFKTECTFWGHQSSKASILLHQTHNNVWEFFGALR